MYNAKYKCRYLEDGVFLETDEVSEAEKDYIRSILYKEDLLNIFSITEKDDIDIFDLVILELYEQINTCDKLRDCMKLSAGKLMSENEHMGLCILYSYDFMHLTHKCVSSYLENGMICMDDLTKLKNKL